MCSQEQRKSPGIKPRFFYGYIVVIIAFLILLLSYGLQQAFGVFFNPILTEFGWTRAMTSGAFSLSMIIYGVLSIAMGGLNDRLGPRLVLTIAGCLLGLGYLLMSQVSTVWQLYLFYGVIIGTGISGIWIPLLSTVAKWFAAGRSTMSGIVVAGTGIGALLGPPAANRLISVYDWRTSYIIMGSIALVIIVLAAQFLRRNPTQTKQVLYGANKRGEQGLRAETGGFSLKEAVHTRKFRMVAIMYFCLGFGFTTIMVYIVPHAIDLKISAASAANILAVMGGISILGNYMLGRLADRTSNRLIYIIGFILISASLFWLVPVREAWMLYLFAVVFGFASGGMAAVESPMVAELFGLSSHGFIYGVIHVGFTIGAAIGPLVTGYMFDVTGSYRLAFFISATIGVVGLIFTALLGPIRGKKEQNNASVPM